MTRFLRAWFPKAVTVAPATRPRFKLGVERLDDRITPTLGFAAQQTFGVGTGPSGVAVGDLNGDGRADVATANLAPAAANTGTTVSVLLNTTPNGTAVQTFAFSQEFTVGTGPIAVAIADFNGDGRADIATANFNNGGNLSVLLNTTPIGAASLSFAPGQDFAGGASQRDVKAGDFNSDGRPDLAVTNSTGVAVLLNTTPMQGGVVTFATTQTFVVGATPGGITVGDFNADGRDDFATGNIADASVTVRLNTAAIGATAPAFGAPATFAVGTQPRHIASGDFNGDGRLDLVTSNTGAGQNSVSVLLNTTLIGAATATFTAQATFTVGALPAGVEAADFDGDGRTDIATVNGSPESVSVLVNTTSPLALAPTFAAKQDFTVSANRGIAAGDFTADGRPEIVVTNSVGTENLVSVLRNTSTNVLPTTTGPALVAQYGTTGVWAYKRDTSAWIQLTAANANALAASASGNVIASFGGNGVWYYRASNQSWTQINGVQALAVAIDPLGNAYVSFTGFGTYRYNLHNGSFTQLTTSVADKLVASPNGDVVGNFPGFGVYRYQRTAPIPFHQINGFNATSLDVDRNGYVVAAFTGFGVGHYIPYAQGWRTVDPAVTANAVALDGSGNVYAATTAGGVRKFDYANTWKNLSSNGATTSLAADWSGNVFASFSGFPGVWEFAPHYGWNWRPQGFALAVSLAK